MTRPKESLLPLEGIQPKLKHRRVRPCSTSPEVDADVWLGTLGSVCREIAAYKGPIWQYLLNSLVAAQNLEYKMRYRPS